MSVEEDKTFSTKEAAAYLKISCSYLYRLVWSNRIKGYKPGGKIFYFKKSDLDSYIYGKSE